MLRNAAGYDPAVMRQVGFDVDRDSVKADPAAQADADCGNLVLAARESALPPAVDPDSDPAVAAFAGDTERCQRQNHPFL